MKIRRYLRQPLVQTALLKLSDSMEIPCEIRNFCQAGLFLKLIRPGTLGQIPNPSEEVEVTFIAYKAESIFRLAGRLTHISNNGAGLVFTRPPPFQVLQALQEVALADPLGENPESDEYDELHEHCIKALEESLQALSDTLSQEIGKLSQGEMALEPIDAPELGSKAQPPSQPEDIGKRVAEKFRTYALDQAKNFVVPDLSLQPESGAIYTESQAQRLVFKDWMNLMDKIIYLESKYDGTLKILEARFSALAEREIGNHNNPFSPNVLLHTFHYTIKEEKFSNAERERIYESLTRRLDEVLDKLYGELRVLTKPLDALTLNLSLDNQATAVFPAADEDWQEAGSAAFLPPAQPSPPPPAKPPSPPVFAPMGNPRARTAQSRSHGFHQSGIGSLPAIPHQPDVFTAFVVLTRYAEAQASRRSGEVATEIDRREIIAALSKQLKAACREPQFPYYSAPKLQEDLSKLLAERGQEKALNCIELRENLQILGLLLDTILADTFTPACIAPYIMKLQIPLLIVSFADPGLLHGKSHPGRDLLNQLDLMIQAANTQGDFDNPQWVNSLDAIFNRIIQEVANKTYVFAEALEAVERLTVPLMKAYTARLERLVEACEGTQRLEHARQMVDREIDARIGGKSVPSVVMALLDAGWRQLLVLTCLRQGTENSDWGRQLAAIDLLVSWLGKRPTLSSPPSPAKIKELKDYLRGGLSGVNSEPVEVMQVLEKIDKLLPHDGSDPIPATYIEIPPADTARIERDNALSFRLAGFRTGDWLKFISAQNYWVPLRLAWIGQDPARYVFTNRKGVKTLELDALKLVQILDDKRASRIESLDGLNLVERTTRSLLSTLRDRLR